LSVLEIPEIIAEISKCYLREKETNCVWVYNKNYHAIERVFSEKLEAVSSDNSRRHRYRVYTKIIWSSNSNERSKQWKTKIALKRKR